MWGVTVRQESLKSAQRSIDLARNIPHYRRLPLGIPRIRTEIKRFVLISYLLEKKPVFPPRVLGVFMSERSLEKAIIYSCHAVFSQCHELLDDAKYTKSS